MNCTIENLCESLENLDSVIKKLQCDSTNLGIVRALFDTVIGHFPETKAHLTKDAAIVESKEFQSALIKLQMDRATELTDEKTASIKMLRRVPDGTVSQEKDLSLAEMALESLRRDQVSSGDYLDTRFILCTSNACELLFSKKRCSPSDYKNSISHTNFEEQIFLHVNRNL